MAKHDPKDSIMEAFGTYPEALQPQKGTLRFLRSRLLPHAQLHEVTFEKHNGSHDQYLYLVVQDSDGLWDVVGVVSSTRNDLFPGEEPHVVLNGSNLNLYGYVIDGDQEVTQVRIMVTDGTILEDTVQDNLVLLIPEQGIPCPIRHIELYNSMENLVSSHLFPYLHPAMRARFYNAVRAHFPDPDSSPVFLPPDW